MDEPKEQMEVQVKIENTSQRNIFSWDTPLIKCNLSSTIKKYLFNPYIQLDQCFWQNLLDMLQQNNSIESQNIKELVSQNIEYVFYKSRHNISILFEQLLRHKGYEQKLRQFLYKVLTQPQVQLCLQLQLFVISHLSQSIILSLLPKIDLKKLINYLCTKMRSLNQHVRLSALTTCYTLLYKGLELNTDCNREYVEQSSNSQCNGQVNAQYNEMLQKEQLHRNMSVSKGILLQLLQDEYYKIRVMCLGCIKLINAERASAFAVDLLNDEHVKVRQYALRHIHCQSLSQQAMGTLLVCLKEKEAVTRSLTYAALEGTPLKHLATVLDCLATTLLKYKDKRQIYHLVHCLACKYAAPIAASIPTYAKFTQDEPNCKYIVHKMRIILVQPAWRNNIGCIPVPPYVHKHILYVRDAENYLFQNQCLYKEYAKEHPIMPLYQPVQNQKQLLQHIQYQRNRSNACYKVILSSLKQLIQSKCSQIHQLNLLTLQYNLTKSQRQCIEYMKEIFTLKSKFNAYQLFTNIIELREKRGQSPSLNKCVLSKQVNNTLIVDRSIINHLYVRCQGNRFMQKGIKNKESTVLKLSNLQILNEDDRNIHLRLNCEYYSSAEVIVKQKIQKIIEKYTFK